MTPTSQAPRRLLPRLALVALCTAAIAAAGCGSAPSSGGGKEAPEHSMPAGSLLYVGVNLDQSSTGWKQFAQVGRRFPGWRHLVGSVMNGLDNSLQSSSRHHTVTFAKDVEPWLGTTAGFAVTSLDASTGKPHMAFVVASTDDGKAENFLHTQGDRSAGSYNGFTLLHSRDGNDHLAVGDHAVIGANDDATLRTVIDTRAGNGGSLASQDGFSTAMAKLPSDSVLRGWVNTQKLSELAGMASLGGLGARSTNGAQLQQLGTALHALDSLTFAAWAAPGGYHLTLRTTIAPGATSSLFPDPNASSLDGLVPADAFAFLAFDGYGDYLKKSLGSTASAPQLRLFEQATGLSLTHDLLPLLSGSDVVYAAPGVPFRAAAVLKPSDPAGAARTMHKLMALIARSDPGMRVSPLRGGEGEQVRTGGFVLTWQRTRDGLITIGNDPAAGTAPAEPLVSSSAFQAVLAKAGAPSGANVAAYFDVAGLLRLIPISTDPNLHHVGAIVAWSDAHGQDRSSDLFVEVR